MRAGLAPILLQPSFPFAAHGLVAAWDLTPGGSWDDFERADGAVGTAPSGQAWMATGQGTLNSNPGIVDGRLWGGTPVAGGNNTYFGIVHKSRPTRVGCRFSWTDLGGETSSGVIIHSSSDPTILLHHMIHFRIGPTGGDITLWDHHDGGAGMSQPFATGDDEAFTFDPPLAIDGTVYEAWMNIDYEANTVTLEMPDGTTRNYGDPLVSHVAGQLCVWQVGGSSASAGYSRLEEVAAYVSTEALLNDPFDGIWSTPYTMMKGVNTSVDATDPVIRPHGSFFTGANYCRSYLQVPVPVAGPWSALFVGRLTGTTRTVCEQSSSGSSRSAVEYNGSGKIRSFSQFNAAFGWSGDLAVSTSDLSYLFVWCDATGVSVKRLDTGAAVSTANRSTTAPASYANIGAVVGANPTDALEARFYVVYRRVLSAREQAKAYTELVKLMAGKP